jgi:hypothetical protein
MARDADALFAALARSGFRSRFRLNPADAAYLQAKGMDTCRGACGALRGRTAGAGRAAQRRQADADAGPPGLCGAACNGNLLPRLPGQVARHSPASGALAGEQQQIVTVLRRWLTAQGGDTIPC